MKDAPAVAPASPPAPGPRRPRSIVRGAFLHGVLQPLVAVAAFGAHEHLRLQGDSTASLVCLVAAAGFALAPVRWLARELLALEGATLHAVHGIGSLAVLGLTLGGVVSGRPVLDRAALAPFAIMGAAQALGHAERPRSREEAEALRRFATSLPEIQRLASSGELTSPASAARAVTVLTDLVAKAQALGEAELRSDPGFQGAVRRGAARVGLALGLDAVDRAVEQLSAQPAAASALPELRRRLAAARAAIEQDEARAVRAEPVPAREPGVLRRAARGTRR